MFERTQVLLEFRVEAHIVFFQSLERRVCTGQGPTTLSKPHGPAGQAGGQGHDQGDQEGPVDVWCHSGVWVCLADGYWAKIVSQARAHPEEPYERAFAVLVVDSGCSSRRHRLYAEASAQVTGLGGIEFLFRGRRRLLIALSVVAQAIFLIWRWRSPSSPPGAISLWVFPGYIIAWAAPRRWMVPALALTVLVNVAYHLILNGVIGAGWRSVRRAV